MREFDDNDLLDLQIEYKNDQTVLDLIEALKDAYEDNYNEMEQFMSDIADELESACHATLQDAIDFENELEERIREFM